MKKKLVYVFRSLAVWGGIERILTDKMNWLAAHGHNVSIITTDQGTHPLPYPLDERVHHIDLGIAFHHQYRYHGLRRLADGWNRQHRFERLLSQQLEQLQPDIIIGTTNCFTATLTRLKPAGTPLIIESHSIFRQLADTGRLTWLRRQRMLHILKKADMLVTLTEGDAREWATCLKQVTHIPNINGLSATGKAVGRKKQVLFVGRLEPQKQPDHLLRIWQCVAPSHPDWSLHIYGDGELRPWVESQVKTMGGSVVLHEPTSHIADCYLESSILVLTSGYEPFGLVMPEAMSCGVPVVAYDCPFGPRDIISDGQDGFLVPPQDTDCFAQKLCRLMDDEELRTAMGRNARSAAQRFHADSIMPQWLQLFEQLT